jgi:glucose dehydrogenase
MTLFRPSRSDNHLSNYWNALVRNAPAEELARLARLVEPSEIAAIEQAHAAHERYEPDPAFARRLEQTIMDTATTMSPLAGTVPHPHVSPPSWNGSRDPGPVSRRRSAARPLRTGWPLKPAVAVGLVLLLVLASAGGIWWITNRDDEPVRLVAPEVATPSMDDATGGWSHFKGDAARSGTTNAGPVSQPVELWRYQAGGPCNPSPAAVGDTVYMACGDGMLTAFDAATGTIRWQFSAEPYVNGPSVADGVAYVFGGSGTLYAVDTTTGAERWRVEGNAFVTSPAVADDTLVAGTSDGVLVGIDTASGADRWRVQVIDDGAVRSPALADGIAYAGSDSGGLVAVDVATGEILWRGDTGTDSTGTTTVHNGIAYISHSPGDEPAALFAFDATTGDLRWQIAEWIG